MFLVAEADEASATEHMVFALLPGNIFRVIHRIEGIRTTERMLEEVFVGYDQGVRSVLIS